MPGVLTFVGDLSVGAALPLPASLTLSVANHGPDILAAIREAIAQLQGNVAQIEQSLALLQSQLLGLAKLQLSVSLQIPNPALIIETIRKTIEKLEKQIEAMLTVGIGVASPLPAQLAAIAANVARIEAQVAQMLTQLATAAAKIAALLTQLSFVNFQVDLALRLAPAMAAAGLDVYRYDGDTASFGTTVQAALGGGLVGGGSDSDQIHAVVIAARTEAAWSGLQVALKVA